MSTLQPGQNAPVPTSALSAVLRWQPGAVGVDISALLLTAAGSVRSDADFVFYNQPAGSGDVVQMSFYGYSEQEISVRLSDVSDEVERIVVAAAIDVIATSGYRSATFQTIAAAAGIKSTRTIS